MTSPKPAVKEKRKYSKTVEPALIRFFRKKARPQFDDFEQLSPVGGVAHDNEHVRQAIYGFHVATCRQPCHLHKQLRDCFGHKVYLILADSAGPEYNTSI